MEVTIGTKFHTSMQNAVCLKISSERSWDIGDWASSTSFRIIYIMSNRLGKLINAIKTFFASPTGPTFFRAARAKNESISRTTATQQAFFSLIGTPETPMYHYVAIDQAERGFYLTR